MNSLFRNATNRQELRFPGDPDQCKELLISYKQHGRLLLQKRKEELCIEARRDGGGWTASWTLTPLETRRFSERWPLYMQVQRLRDDGVQESGEVMELDVINVLDHTIL